MTYGKYCIMLNHSWNLEMKGLLHHLYERIINNLLICIFIIWRGTEEIQMKIDSCDVNIQSLAEIMMLVLTLILLLCIFRANFSMRYFTAYYAPLLCCQKNGKITLKIWDVVIATIN